jgi:hypothetical protein
MRARITTTLVVLAALAIPAGADAQAIDGGYSSVNSIAGARDDPGQPAPDPDYSSVNAITGLSTEAPTVVSAAPVSGDQFDWGDAALGAGAALALMAYGGAALLTVRRRTPVSPSASTS